MIKNKALSIVSSIMFLSSLTACGGGTSYTPVAPAIPNYTQISDTSTKKTCTCKNKTTTEKEVVPKWSEVDPSMVVKPVNVTQKVENKAVAEKKDALNTVKLPEIKSPTTPSTGTGSKTDTKKEETFLDKVKNKLNPKNW
jgi:hypothetical protein